MTAQLALNFDSPRARRRDPSTSKAAGAAAASFVSDHHARILRVMVTSMTCFQIGEVAGLDHVAVARRMHELVDLGKVRDSGKTAPGKSGRQCILWERIE